MRERFFRFMQGRYGVDALGKFLIYCGLLLALVNMLFHNIIISVICIIIWCIAYFRIFSRDIYKRMAENTRYLNAKACITGGAKDLWRRIVQKIKPQSGGSREGRNDNYSSRCNSFSGNCYDALYKVYKCPKCRQKLRVPRGKGKIRIICRRCKYEFVRRT